MVIGGAEEQSQERFGLAHGNHARAFVYSESAASMKPGGSRESKQQQASPGSGTGWMSSLLDATPYAMIETLLASIVRGFSAKPSNNTINGQ